RPGAPHARVLPLGRDPQRLAGAPPRLRLALADRVAGRARDHRGRLEPPAARVGAGRGLRARTFDLPAAWCYKALLAPRPPRAPSDDPRPGPPRPERTNALVTFPDVETQAQSPVNLTRTKRQLADQAIAQASAAEWADAAATNRKLLELGPDAEAHDRLADALSAV